MESRKEEGGDQEAVHAEEQIASSRISGLKRRRRTWVHWIKKIHILKTTVERYCKLHQEFYSVLFTIYLVQNKIIQLYNIVSVSVSVSGRSTGLVTLRHHQHGVLISRRSREDSGGNTTAEDLSSIEYVVRQHEETTLLCDIANITNGMSLRWLHNGIEIDPGHRYARDALTSRLTISLSLIHI